MSLFLVTGGAGFIGSHLVDKLLASGHQVRVLDNLSTGSKRNVPSGVELIAGDVSNAMIVNEALQGVEGVFHLAAVASVERSTADWLVCHRTNVGGTVTVLDCVGRRSGSRPCPVVYASSAAVYGLPFSAYLSEKSATIPITPYGVDKLASEMHARAAAIHYGIPSVGLRFFNVYGPRQDPASPYSGVISLFAQRLLSGGPLTIHGDGEQTRDFIYVDDVIRHLIAGFERAASETPRVFNVCTGNGTKILELARNLGATLDIDPVLRFEEKRAGDIRHSVGDPTASARFLGVTAEVPFGEGLCRTISHLSNAKAWSAA